MWPDSGGYRTTFNPVPSLERRGVRIICLLWLLSQDPGGGRELRPWTDDFSHLYEGYVRFIIGGLGEALVGGRYVPDIPWRAAADQSGQIDGLISSSGTLFIIEVKASILRRPTLEGGTVEALREELERKFIFGEAGKPKGLRQLARAIDWLMRERRHGRMVAGIDLTSIDTIVPVLIVADRGLRFPGLGEWFDYRMRQLLRRSWGRVGPLTICGAEDLEGLEQLARQGEARLVDFLFEYSKRFRNGEQPLWRILPAAAKPHPRLDAIMDAWIRELQTRRVLPA